MQSLFGYLYKRISRLFRVYEISRFLASHIFLKVIYSNYSVGFSKISIGIFGSELKSYWLASSADSYIMHPTVLHHDDVIPFDS